MSPNLARYINQLLSKTIVECSQQTPGRSAPFPHLATLHTETCHSPAVTSRLEDVATSQSSPAATSSLRSPTSTTHETIAGHMSRPAASASASSHAPPTTSQAPSADLTPSAKAYGNEIIEGPLSDFTTQSKAVGGVVEQIVLRSPQRSCDIR